MSFLFIYPCSIFILGIKYPHSIHLKSLNFVAICITIFLHAVNILQMSLNDGMLLCVNTCCFFIRTLALFSICLDLFIQCCDIYRLSLYSSGVY